MESTPITTGRRNTTSSAESLMRSEDSGTASPARSATGSSTNQAGSVGRSFFARRDTGNTAASSDSSTSGEMKKTTLAATVTNAAEQARQWGWNAIRRQREQRRNGDKPHPIDLSQPMGRGQPLPPPGTPLPGPSDGTSRFGVGQGTKRKPVPAPASIPEQTSAELEDSDKESRSSQPPPLPQRRRRGASQQQEEEIKENMLIVAAPDDDSRPGTPAAEDRAICNKAWANGAGKESHALSELQQAKVALSLEHEVVPETLQEITNSPLNSMQQVSQEPLMSNVEVTKETPLIALPATVAVVDDDDDFSGWMDNDDNGGDEAVAPPRPVTAPIEVKQTR